MTFHPICKCSLFTLAAAGFILLWMVFYGFYGSIHKSLLSLLLTSPLTATNEHSWVVDMCPFMFILPSGRCRLIDSSLLPPVAVGSSGWRCLWLGQQLALFFHCTGATQGEAATRSNRYGGFVPSTHHRLEVGFNIQLDMNSGNIAVVWATHFLLE